VIFPHKNPQSGIGEIPDARSVPQTRAGLTVSGVFHVKNSEPPEKKAQLRAPTQRDKRGCSLMNRFDKAWAAKD